MRYLLSFILLLSGCGRGVTLPSVVTFGNDSTLEFVNLTSFYIKELNTFVEKEFFTFTTSSPRSHKITISYSKTPSPNNYAGLAYVGASSCDIIIYPLATDSNILKTVLWHELAHCLNIGHTETLGQIMSPGVRPFQAYTQEALNLFRLQMLSVLSGGDGNGR